MADTNGASPDTQNGSYEPLEKLGSSRMKITHKNKGDGDDSKYAYSKVIGVEQAKTKTFYGFARDGAIDDTKAIPVFEDLFEDSRRSWVDPNKNREGRAEREEELAKKWERALTSAQKAQVETLLNRWNEGHAYMAQILIRCKKYGFDAVRHLRAEWKDSQKKVDDAEFDTRDLTPASYQLFWCRVRQYTIMRERAEDLALGIPEVDFTPVKRKIAEGVPIDELIDQLPWQHQLMRGMVEASHVNGQQHRMSVWLLNAGAVPAEIPDGKGSTMELIIPRSGKKKGRGGKGHKDRTEEEEDE